ncbi:MAG TPA: DUF1461 domain-containing protein [Cellvibrionaceae bacterium]
MTRTILLWPLFLICHWLVAGFIAWHLLAQVDFAYASAYKALNIGAHIEEFAPQNRHREHFADTDKTQHLALFAEINHAIHKDPARLAKITYTAHDGLHRTLMHRDEVLHLNDVARLIKGVYTLGFIALALWLLAGGLLIKKRCAFPRPSRIIVGAVGGIAVIVVGVLAIGAKKVFYVLHEWIFPPDHPWFFYYQDSLMTTLMKAPDLFGFIAVILLGLWLLLWLASLWLQVRYWPRSRPS